MLDQRRRRWADVVQMLYKCFVLVGIRVFVILIGRYIYPANQMHKMPLFCLFMYVLYTAQIA